MERFPNPKTGLLPDPDCKICRGSNLLILDATQVTMARQRWQWADLGPGANYCVCTYPEA